MNVKKILAGTVASVMAVTSLAAITSAADVTVEQGVFVLGFGDGDWKAAFWGKSDDTLDASYETTAKLDGNGTYTVAVDLSKGYTADGWEDEATGDPLTLTTGNSIGAMGIQIYGEYPTLGVNITKVVVDGVEQTLTGASYTNDEDGGRRTNIYNEWANFDATKEDHISKDPDNASATLIDKAAITEWSKIEVTFEVYGLEEDNSGSTGNEGDTTTAPDNGDTNTTTPDKNTPDTGVEGVAIVAAGAVVVAKKRK